MFSNVASGEKRAARSGFSALAAASSAFEKEASSAATGAAQPSSRSQQPPPAPPCPPFTITVVYNALVWPHNNWRMIIRGQTEDLVRSGLARCADVRVVLSAPAAVPGLNLTQADMEELLLDADIFVWSMLAPHVQHPNTHLGITLVHENAYEYPGMHLLWSLASRVPAAAAPTHLLLYMHSKGMVNHGGLEQRLPCEHWQLNTTVLKWRRIIEIFQQNATITRAGLLPADRGHVWYNFWWARASYLQRLPEPLRETRSRFYYERYLGHELEDGSRSRAGMHPGLFYDGRHNSSSRSKLHRRQRPSMSCDTCYSLSPARSGAGVAFSFADALAHGCPPKAAG